MAKEEVEEEEEWRGGRDNHGDFNNEENDVILMNHQQLAKVG